MQGCCIDFTLCEILRILYYQNILIFKSILGNCPFVSIFKYEWHFLFKGDQNFLANSSDPIAFLRKDCHSLCNLIHGDSCSLDFHFFHVNFYN